MGVPRRITGKEYVTLEGDVLTIRYPNGKITNLFEQATRELKVLKASETVPSFIGLRINKKNRKDEGVLGPVKGRRHYKDLKIWDLKSDLMAQMIHDGFGAWIPEVYDVYLGVTRQLFNNPLSPVKDITISCLERCYVNGVKVESHEFESIPQYLYFMNCVRNNKPVNMEEFLDRADAIISNNAQPLLYIKSENLNLDEISHFEPVPSESRNLDDISHFTPSPVPASCPAVEMLESRNLDDISHFMSGLSGIDFSALAHIIPTEDKADEILNILRGIKSILEPINVVRTDDTPKEKIRIPGLPKGGSSIAFIIPENRGKLKPTELDIYSEERQAFMRHTIERWWTYNNNGMSEPSSSKAVIAEMLTVGSAFKHWHDDFCNANRGKKKGQINHRANEPYFVEPHNVTSWAKGAFRIIDNKVISKNDVEII